MKIRNLLSTLALAAVISVPMLVSNTANAGERNYSNGHARSNYQNGYGHGYRDSAYAGTHSRRRPSHNYYYNPPHVALGYNAGHGYRRGYGGGHSSGIDFIFRF